MRILMLTTQLGFDGASKMFMFVATGLQKRGHKVVIAQIEEKIFSNDYPIPNEITNYFINSSNKKVIKRLEQVKAITKIGRLVNTDIIISFKFIPNLVAVLAGKRLKVPTIIAERCDPFNEIEKNFANRLIIKIINLSQGAVFQTIESSKFYSKQLQSKCAIIPNPVFRPPEIYKPDFVAHSIVYVGRIEIKQKRVDLLISAFASFAKKNKDYNLQIYGGGPDENTISSLITKNNLENRVFMNGVTLEPLKKMCESSIFITTSDYEGISNSLLEAMSIGMPVIATDCSPGSARMLIKNGENGILVKRGDADGIARALHNLSENLKIRKKLSNNAKKIIDLYNPDLILEKWENYMCGVFDCYHK